MSLVVAPAPTMIDGIKLKICGITSVADAEAAVTAGADFLGFVFYPRSARHDPSAQYQTLKEKLPSRPKVAVCADPVDRDLREIVRLGFDFIQIHCNPDTLTESVAGWAKMAGTRRLWLAPRLPAASDVFPELLPYADTFLLDIFHATKPGGGSRTGDWEKFKRHRATHPDKQWILTGGLDPVNVGEAVRATGADFLDVNSGIEQKPGMKSPAKLKAFTFALHQAAKRGPAPHP
ncbi:MAG: Phosphoribosylanthranilate isomerase [Lacunisphaera sp.]|nr:Phosphoribosylanthranilate isomerase [Lacunisphaera sp.]